MFLLKRSHYRLLLIEQAVIEKSHQIETDRLNNEINCLNSEIKRLQEKLLRVKDDNSALRLEVSKQSAIEKENRQLKAKSDERFSRSYANYKKAYIDHHIAKIDDEASFGCGSYYEIYEERRQEGIANFIASNRPALSKYDKKYIKSQYDYDPNFQPYTEIDKETGEELTIWDIVRREQV